MGSEMEQEVNTKLVDEYINSLSQKVNELQQENLLLKAKASYNEKEYQERELQLKLEHTFLRRVQIGIGIFATSRKLQPTFLQLAANWNRYFFN